MNAPIGLALDETTGCLYVAEYGNHLVRIFNEEHKPIAKVGTGRNGIEPGEFSYLWSIALDRHCNLVVCDCGNDRVQVSPLSHTLSKIPKKLPPLWLHLVWEDESLRILLLLFVAFILRVVVLSNCFCQIFNSEHQFVQQIGKRGKGPNEMSGPRHPVIAPDGRLIICEGENHRIQIFHCPDDGEEFL